MEELMDTKIGKREQAMNDIIASITSGEKKAGDYLTAKDYNLGTQMRLLYKELVEAGIVKMNKANFYELTENCFDNAQELYYEKIMHLISLIKLFADVANIPTDCLVDLFKGEMKKRCCNRCSE